MLVIVVIEPGLVIAVVMSPLMLMLTLAGPGATTTALVVMLIELVSVGAGVVVEAGWYPIAVWLIVPVPVAATSVKGLP